MKARAEVGFAIAGFGLLLLLVYADPLLTGRNIVARDLIAYNLPMEKTIHDAYARGRLPVWSSEVSGGRPLLPNPNAGALYPIRILLSRIPFPLAMRIFPALHWLAAAAGTILFLKTIGRSLGAAWLGAVTYVFSGVAISEIFFPHYLPSMALIPWILWAAQRKWRREALGLVVLGFLFALVFLAGEILAILLAIACAALWIALETPRPERWRRARELALALALASLLVAPQIAASAFWVGDTVRAVTGVALGSANLYSLAPARLLELVIPYPFGPTWALEPKTTWAVTVFRDRPIGLFSTLYAGAFAVMAVLVMTRKSAPGVRFAKVLLAGTAAVCVLPSLIPRSWWTLTSPIGLRNPEKFAVGMIFGLSVFSALAWDRQRESPSSLRPAFWIGLVLATVAMAATAFPAAAGHFAARALGAPADRFPTAVAQLPPALTQGALLWVISLLALAVARSPRPAAGAAALLLLTAVPVAANRKIPGISETNAFAPTPFARRLLRMDPAGSFRTLGESVYRNLPSDSTEPGVATTYASTTSWTENSQALWGRGTVFNTDFDSGDFVRMESLRTLSYQAAVHRDAGNFFGSLALKWGIRYHGQEIVPGYRRFGGDAITDWDEHEHAYPDIRLLESWAEEVGTVEALRSIPKLGAGEIVIETGTRRRGAARAGSCRILEKTPERLVLETDSPDPTWLFVLREHWKHRDVRVDGVPGTVEPAQLAFSALAIPSGKHRVVWKEQAPAWKTSRWGPVLFVLIALAASKSRAREGAEKSQLSTGSEA